MTDYPTLSPIDLDMLIFMARFGRILKRHAAKLWFRGQQVTAWRRLSRLHELGLVAKAAHYHAPNTARRTPTPQGELYILTERGEELVREAFFKQDSERFTTLRKGIITHQAEHQIELIDFMVQLLGLVPQIPGIIGINGAIEMRLGLGLEPRCDGLVWIRRWANASDAGDEPPCDEPLIPWLRDKGWPGQASRWYAIEIDRNTEAANVIAAKARAYRQVFEAGHWKGRFQWPVPVFVVPTEGRRTVVLREWERGWPGSPIMITTRPQLEQHGIDGKIWIAQHNSVQIARGFVEAWWDWVLKE